MRIAHIVCTYPPYFGGMGNVVFETVSSLIKLGHDVEVFTPAYYEAKEIRPKDAPEARVHEPMLQSQVDYASRLKPRLAYGNAAWLPDIEKEFDRFDIVHLHYPFFGTANLVRRWKLAHPDRPLVITYHMDTRGNGWKGLLFKWYSAYWMPRILGVADRLITSSFDYIAESQAQKLYREHPERWLELPFGVDTERFSPGPKNQALCLRHEIDPSTSTVLFVGGMDSAHYFKGIPVLLKAVYQLKLKRQDVQAILVGDGDLRERYELIAKGMGLSDRVRFVGSVSATELPEYYRLGDVCVLPSIHRGEAFGMVILEAFASGVPVIASDLPGVRAVARDGGMVFPPNDELALAQALTQFFEQDQSVLQRRVRLIAEKKYSWDQMAQRLDALYSSLLLEG